MKSDIKNDYGHFEVKDSKSAKHIKHYAAKKNKTISWLVTDCYTPSYREAYVRELQKYIHVDIKGRCAAKVCKGHRACLNDTAQYKFYLSFENSLCEDYITEKVWKVLRMDTVPVVLGHANYTKLLPPRSYIDVRNFQSPYDLAKYLQYLDDHDDEYNKYLEWKQDYFVPEDREHDKLRACQLCEYLHVNKGKHKTVDTLWDRVKECVHYKKFYRGIANVISNTYLGYNEILWH
jgi:hypothetical protein